MSENTSGMKTTVPPELQGGWNWGAFWFSWIWLFNHRLIGWGIGLLVLSFIPYVSVLGLGAAIYMGIKGNELGWQNRRFESVEDFKACQKIWAKWVIGMFLVTVVLVIIAAIMFPILAQAGLRANGGRLN